MSWFKVDDKLWGHPKWLATPIRSRGLWVTAGSWSAAQEQDGRVPRHVLAILGGTLRDASGLVASGLWTVSDSGWLFHGWADFQPTREQKDTDREAARERMRAGRERAAARRSEDVRPNISEVRDVFARSSEDVRDAHVRSTPTRPDPSRPVLKEEVPSGTAVAAPRDDVDRICNHLAGRIEANGSKRPTITKTWTDEARRLIDIDHRTEDQIVRAIDWCQGDDFWRGNVLSMGTLRKKYDQLRLASQRTGRPVDRQADLLRSEMVKAQAADARATQFQIGAA